MILFREICCWKLGKVHPLGTYFGINHSLADTGLDGPGRKALSSRSKNLGSSKPAIHIFRFLFVLKIVGGFSWFFLVVTATNYSQRPGCNYFFIAKNRPS